jgi:glucosylglycerate phosphorylase
MSSLATEERIHHCLGILYGQDKAELVWRQLRQIMDEFSRKNPPSAIQRSSLSEQDAFLITYGDNFQAFGESHLQTLAKFVNHNLGDAISGIHILPFFPFSSDDGFSVIDYREIDPKLGDWEDIRLLGEHHLLMFDAVINHLSRRSQWFEAYLRDEHPYQDYFITAQAGWDLSQVARPRTLPLLTDVNTLRGQRSVWTTFSDDQIDLNYANPQVLIEIISLLLFYVERGATVLRLDAIAYLWKEPGTSCIHLPQTHAVIKILRAVLDLLAPQVFLITETNVPHQENISYFGNYLDESGGTDEAQLVYQFPLAPLILHTFATANTHNIHEWIGGLEGKGIFFNFTASHDGIGVQPVQGLLSESEIQTLAERTIAHGGYVSNKSNPDGTHSPYELNITFFDALNNPTHPASQVDLDRFIASQVIMLSLAGVPGIYVHSLFGSSNCVPCVQESGRARSINREKFDYTTLQAELELGQSRRAHILSTYRKLLVIRRQQPAFHPSGAQEVINLNSSLFSIVRFIPHDRPVACLVNVSPDDCVVCLDLAKYNLPTGWCWQDLIGGRSYSPTGSRLELTLAPYQSCWLAPWF